MSNFLQAAKYTDRKPKPHQAAAWQWAWELLTIDQREEFLEMFRADPVEKPGVNENPYYVVAPLLELIRKYESSDNYNAVNKGRSGDTPGGWQGLTSLSIAEVMRAQADKKLFAAGAYQIIPATLKELMDRAGMPPSIAFSEEAQDWLGVVLVLGGWKRPHLTAYLLGQSNDLNKAQDDLAYEWASLPGSSGRGMYDGDSAGNRSHASVVEVRETLSECRRRIDRRPLIELGLTPPAAKTEAKPKPADYKILDVRQYYSQRDSATGHSNRMCFSSTCAMLLKFLQPKALKGVNADDAYLRTVFKHGDTTIGSAQVKALAEYGIEAAYTTTARVGDIERYIDKGFPVPVGWLHRGHVSAPSGGGHWSLIYGYDKTHFYVMDPWGDPDLVTGATISSNGKGLKFSRKNFLPRWEPEGPGHGYAILVSKVR